LVLVGIDITWLQSEKVTCNITGPLDEDVRETLEVWRRSDAAGVMVLHFTTPYLGDSTIAVKRLKLVIR
jgi:hypothetical protein